MDTFKMNVNERLVYLIRNHPAIWDKNDRCYRDKTRKLQDWRKIATLCSFRTIEECKAKWKALREKYRREQLSEEKMAFTDDPYTTRTSWYLLDGMKFLGDVTSRGLINEDNGTVFENTDSFSGLIKEEIDFETEENKILDSTSIMETSLELQSGTVETNAHGKRKREGPSMDLSTELTDVLYQIKMAVHTLAKSGQNCSPKENKRITSFASYVREELLELPIQQAEILMEEFMTKLLDVRKKIRDKSESQENVEEELILSDR